MKSQNQAILQYLKKGNAITPLEAYNMFKCMRLARVVGDLKSDGYNISSTIIKDERTGKRYASYKLIKKQTGQLDLIAEKQKREVLR